MNNFYLIGETKEADCRRGSCPVWILTLPSNVKRRREVGKFYRLLAKLRRRYPHPIERPALSTLVLRTETLAYMVVRAIMEAGGRYTIDRSITGQPVGLDTYAPLRQ